MSEQCGGWSGSTVSRGRRADGHRIDAFSATSGIRAAHSGIKVEKCERVYTAARWLLAPLLAGTIKIPAASIRASWLR